MGRGGCAGMIDGSRGRGERERDKVAAVESWHERAMENENSLYLLSHYHRFFTHLILLFFPLPLTEQTRAFYIMSAAASAEQQPAACRRRY